MFACSICSRSFGSVLVWLSHSRMHANSSNVCFRCCFPHCHSVLLTHHALRMHVLRNHEVKCRRVVQHNGASLECSVDMCSFTSNDFSVHIAHLKSHILSGIAIACPFKNCRKTFLKKSSFSSHVSQCHKYLHFLSSQESSCPNVSVSEMLNSESDLCERTGEHVNEDNFDDDDDNSGVISEDRKSEFLNCIALFCLKLQAKFLLSASKIQQIIDEFVNIHTISQTFTKAKLLGTLSEHGLSTEQLKGIATELEMNDLFKSHFDEGVLRSHNRRKTFYKKNFHYVSPQEVYLGSLAEKHQLYQAFHSMGDLFPPMLQCDNGQPFSISLYNEDVKSAVLKSNLNLDDVATFTKLTFQGIEYHCGLFVVVSKCESGFVFGKIVFLLVSGDNRIDFLVETFQSERDDKLHLYVIENKAKSIELININNLIDYYPLPVYNFLNKQVIVLHHAIL